MTINWWFLVAATLLSTPVAIMTWVLAWVNGRRRAQCVAVALSAGLLLFIVGCGVSPAYALDESVDAKAHAYCFELAQIVSNIVASKEAGAVPETWLQLSTLPEWQAFVLDQWDNEPSLSEFYAGCMAGTGDWGYEL